MSLFLKAPTICKSALIPVMHGASFTINNLNFMMQSLNQKDSCENFGGKSL